MMRMVQDPSVSALTGQTSSHATVSNFPEAWSFHREIERRLI